MEEMYVTQLKNGQTFRCVKSQLAKTGGKCPVWGHVVDLEMKANHEAMLIEKAKKEGQ